MSNERNVDRCGQAAARLEKTGAIATFFIGIILLVTVAQAQPTFPVFGPPVYSPFGIRPVIQVPAVDLPQVSANKTFGYPLTPNTWNTNYSYSAPHPSGLYYYPDTQIPTAQVNQADRISMQENRATIIRNGMTIGMLRRQRRQLYYQSNLVEKQLNNDRLLRKWQYQREWEKTSAPYRKASQKGKFDPPSPDEANKKAPAVEREVNNASSPNPPAAE